MLPDGELKPCTPDPMRSGLEILKIYPDLLSIGIKCVKMTLSYVFEIPMNP
jgi:hypothetical protein